jgi:phosphoglycerate dehydrogenase-like enzyme
VSDIIIFSASGAKTFTREQLEQLRQYPITFIKNITEMDNDDFIQTTKSARILGITRRTLKNISSDILQQLPALKHIALYATGYEWIDYSYAQQNNICINYLPDYSAQTVAEHTICLILCMYRRIHLSYDRTRKLVPETTSIRGSELSGKTVGIVGLGTIGTKCARLLEIFGVNILFHDIKKITSNYTQVESLHELLKLSDIVILLIPHERGCAPIIGDNELAIMKKTAMLINTSRSALVDNQAILEHLSENSIAGYAIDDTIEEFNDKDILPGKILQTGHSAWYSDEAIERGTQQWVDNIIPMIHNRPINIIPELL